VEADGLSATGCFSNKRFSKIGSDSPTFPNSFRVFQLSSVAIFSRFRGFGALPDGLPWAGKRRSVLTDLESEALIRLQIEFDELMPGTFQALSEPDSDE
jgi:hypothetical protein